MNRRDAIAIIGGAALVWPIPGRTQQPDRVRRLGVLMSILASDPDGRANAATFVQGLGALDWRDGDNLHIEWRWAGSDPEGYERCAAELVALDPEVLLANGGPSIEALRRHTSTIPIVFTSVGDPVGQGFVASLPHPGGAITGFTSQDPPMAAKWLGMLTQITPPVATVAVLYDPATALITGLMLRAIEEAAPSLKVAVRAAPCRDEFEIETMMTAFAREGHGALLVLPEAFTVVHRDAIIVLAARYRLPAIYPIRFFVANGGLMSYGVDINDLFRRAASYVDRIFKGKKPGDLPVQNPTKFQMAINLKTAKALGVTVAPALLATADEVIE